MIRNSRAPDRPRGLNVLRLFGRVEGEVKRERIAAAIENAKGKGLQVVTAEALAAKGDVAFKILGENLWNLRLLQTYLQAAGLTVGESYVSVTEVSEYGAGMLEQMLNDRRYPVLPLKERQRSASTKCPSAASRSTTGSASSTTSVRN